MVRYFEVRGLYDKVEYFGFMDTSIDRVIEFDGEQFFLDYMQFTESVSVTWLQRLDELIPERVKR